MTPKQKMDYVIQITAGLVSFTGNTSTAKAHLPRIVELVEAAEAALKRSGDQKAEQRKPVKTVKRTDLKGGS